MLLDNEIKRVYIYKLNRKIKFSVQESKKTKFMQASICLFIQTYVFLGNQLTQENMRWKEKKTNT